MSSFPLHDKALALAKGEIGIQEQPLGSNSGMRVREYQQATFVPGSGWPWCVAFWLWCWQEAQHPLPYKTAGAYAMLNWARGAGWAKPSSELVPGDGVVFNVGSGHLAMFEKWEGGYIHTIDGNHGNRVARATRPHSLVAGGIHVPEIAAPVHVPKPYWVIASSENGKRVLLYSRFATQKTILGLLPRLFAKYGRSGVTIKRGKERGK